jgi:hypothetical protein
MSSKKIKHKENIKTLNKKIKEAFQAIDNDVQSGKISFVRSIRGLIHCNFDEHQEFINVSALKDGKPTPSIYFRLDALSENTLNLVFEELKNSKDQIIEQDEVVKLIETNTSNDYKE